MSLTRLTLMELGAVLARVEAIDAGLSQGAPVARGKVLREHDELNVVKKYSTRIRSLHWLD